MTWLLVFWLLHADGTTTESNVPGFESEDKCRSTGKAWAAQAVRRDETVTVIVRCKSRTAASP